MSVQLYGLATLVMLLLVFDNFITEWLSPRWNVLGLTATQAVRLAIYPRLTTAFALGACCAIAAVIWCKPLTRPLRQPTMSKRPDG